MTMKRAAAIVVFLLPAAAGADAAGPAPCGLVLTAAEVKEAAGDGWASLGQEQPEPGKSECTWLREDGPNPRAIALTYWARDAVKGAVPAGLFETQAKRAETVHANSREILPGIGEKAVLVPGKRPGAMAVLVLQTSAGVAYVETDYLERPQLLRLARAIATP